MREFIKKKLQEQLSSISEAGVKTVKAYHGTPQKIKKFSDAFVGGSEAVDQEGPGIYFTTSFDEATKYGEGGGYVYQVKLSYGKLVSDKPNIDLDYLMGPMTKIVKMSPDWKKVARGYDDDLEEGLSEMVHRYVGMAQSEKEAFVVMYGEVYKSNPVAYVKNMVKLGYDGVYLPTNDGGAHIVIYKPSAIKVTGEKQIN